MKGMKEKTKTNVTTGVASELLVAEMFRKQAGTKVSFTREKSKWIGKKLN